MGVIVSCGVGRTRLESAGRDREHDEAGVGMTSWGQDEAGVSRTRLESAGRGWSQQDEAGVSRTRQGA